MQGKHVCSALGIKAAPMPLSEEQAARSYSGRHLLVAMLLGIVLLFALGMAAGFWAMEGITP